MARPKQLPSGKWQVVVDAPPHPDGSRNQIKRTFWTKREAEKFVAQSRLDRLDAKKHLPKGPTVGAFTDEFFKHRANNLSPTTLRGYRTITNRHIRHDPISEIPLTSLSADDIRAWLSRLADKPGRRGDRLSPRTIQRCFRFLATVINVAISWGRIDSVPLANVEVPVVRRDPSTTMFWTAEQVGRFMRSTASAQHDSARMWRDVWGLALATGLRRGELAGLRWVDIDFDNDELHVSQTRLAGVPGASPPKSHHSNRTIPLATEATAFLQDLRALQEVDRRLIGDAWIDTGLVVVFPTGQSPQPDTFSQRFRRDCEGAGVPLISLHGLRHTHATLALASGSPIHDVSRTAGHSSVAFTLSTYGHFLPAGHRSSIQKASHAIFKDVDLSPLSEGL